MEGGASDLRTGLPKQMVEIHEAMRLLVVTEHKPEVVAAIYGRQPPLRELIGNAWLQVATVDPIRAPFGNSIPPANLSSSGRDHRKRRPR